MSRTTYDSRRGVDSRRSEALAARDRRRRMLLKRVRLTRTILVGTILVMMVALANLQVLTSTDSYPDVTRAGSKTRPVKAMRGDITDRAGDALAATIEVRNVYVDQTMVLNAKSEARELAPLLLMDASLLEQKMTGKNRYVMLKRGLSQSLWSRISALGLPGIAADRDQIRSYPEGTLTASLLGHLNSEGIAQEGLELQYNKLLAGRDGERSQYGGVAGAGNDQGLKRVLDGSSLRLTIDRTIQSIAQLKIAEKVKEARAESGSVIVLDVKTGEILALATAPTFDPENITTEALPYLSNRALSEMYEPGSTGKVMTMAAIIDAGMANPGSKYKVPYAKKCSDGYIHDHKRHPTLNLTLAGILAKSSNTGTITAADPMTKDQLYSYFTKFGIGQPTGLKFPSESAGTLVPTKEWYGRTACTIPFGQGYQVTALQAANVFATIANDGVRLTPRLVAGVTDANGLYTPTVPSQGVRVVSKNAATAVREMMESVVSDEGTAPKAKIPGYRVAGKTGTAQIWNNVEGRWHGYVASFIGFAPADNPRIVVAVSLVKPKNGHYGGVLAAPVFKKVMTVALEQFHIPATGSPSPKLPLTW